MKTTIKKSVSIITVLALLLLCLAGCTSKEEKAYIESMDTISHDAEDAANKMNDSLALISDTDGSPEDMDKIIEAFDGIRTPFEQLIALEAPEKYSAAHTKIKTGSQGILDMIDGVVTFCEKMKEAETIDMTDAAAVDAFNAEITQMSSDLATLVSTANTSLTELQDGLQEAEDIANGTTKK